MTERPLRHSRRDLDRLADGANDSSPLGDLVVSMRSMGDGEGVTPSAALAEFVSSPSPGQELVLDSVAHDEETNRMIPHLTALITTTAGKIAIGGGVAAAAITGIALVEPEPVDDVLITATADSTPTTGVDTTVAITSTTDGGVGATPSTTANAETTETTETTQLTVTTGVASVPPDTVDVPGVGVVTYTVVEFQPTLVSIEVADGWTVIDESTPGEIDLSFRAADGRRVDVDIEREDGEIRVRVEDESDTAVDLDDNDFDDSDLDDSDLDDSDDDREEADDDRHDEDDDADSDSD